MTLRPGRVLRAVAAAGALALAGTGCGPGEEPAPTGGARPQTDLPRDAGSLPPVTLPDLSSLLEPVQERLRAPYQALNELLAGGSATPAELAAAYGELGIIMMVAEFFETAEACFLHAHAHVPSDPRWPYYLAHRYRTDGEQEEAAEYFERTLALRPNDLAALVWLGEVYLLLGRTDEAEPLFLRALGRDAESAAALSGAGRAALARESYAQAADFLERAVAYDPGATSLYYPLGLAYAGLGDDAKAEETLARRGDGLTFPADPLLEELQASGLLDSPLDDQERGLEAFAAGRFAEAAEIFRGVLELAPDNLALRLRLGTTLFLAGDPRGAAEQFEIALRVSPDLPRAHFGLGVILDAGGRHREAIEKFTAALDLDPAYLEARLALAEALRVTGQVEESLPHYERLVETAPDYAAEAWISGADILVRLDRYEEADAWLRRARDAYPDRAELVQLAETVETILSVRRALAR
ncbi:MAG: tetratricopeptide repeat protein, partial [Acidobacteria bacterium]|nr:tetratricopeptide repeat protein [Acidobacteriota bacterium]